MTFAQILAHGLLTGVTNYTLLVKGRVDDEVIVELHPLLTDRQKIRAVIKDERVRVEPPR